MRVNSIDKLIISSALVKRLRSINYKSNSSNNFVINYNFNLIILKVNFKTFDRENFKLKKKRKLNLEIITYYYRCLNHFENIT